MDATWLKYAGKLLYQSFSPLPVIGSLADCSWSDHKAAIKEFLIAVLFGTATFWLSAFFLMYLEKNKNSSYKDLLVSTVGNGELFIFAVGFLGSTLIIAFDDPRGARRFPGQIWHAVALFVLGVLCAGSFALVRLVGGEPTLIALDKDFLLLASLWLAGFAAALRYLAVVYRKFTLRPDDALKDPERRFAQEFADRHKGDEQ